MARLIPAEISHAVARLIPRPGAGISHAVARLIPRPGAGISHAVARLIPRPGAGISHAVARLIPRPGAGISHAATSKRAATWHGACRGTTEGTCAAGVDNSSAEADGGWLQPLPCSTLSESRWGDQLCDAGGRSPWSTATSKRAATWHGVCRGSPEDTWPAGADSSAAVAGGGWWQPPPCSTPSESRLQRSLETAGSRCCWSTATGI